MGDSLVHLAACYSSIKERGNANVRNIAITTLTEY